MLMLRRTKQASAVNQRLWHIDSTSTAGFCTAHSIRTHISCVIVYIHVYLAYELDDDTRCLGTT